MAERIHWWTERLLRFPLFLSLSLTIYLPTYLPIYLSIYRSIYVSIHLSIYPSIYLSIYISLSLARSLFHLITYLSLDLSICLSVCLPACLSVCTLENEASLRDFLSFWTWQHQKRSNSARLPQFLNLTTSKTKQFCETSSFFKVGNWQHQKRSNSARLPSKMESWVQSCTASYQCVLWFFPLHLSKVLRLHEKVMPGHTKCCTCPAKSSEQTWRSAAPKMATPLRKSAPGHSNISDEYVSCNAPATRNASFQILFKCPTTCHRFWTCYKNPHVLLTFDIFWQGAQSRAPATRNNIWTSKSGSSMWCF